MTLDQARTLKSALERGIARAEAVGADTMDLQGELDASLGEAIAQLQAAIDDAKQQRPQG